MGSGRWAVSFAIALASCGTARRVPPTGAKSVLSARQMIFVVTRDWNATDGVLQRYGRKGERAAWMPVGDPIAVVIGRNGMGWGLGLHGPPPGDGPRKQEQDGRSPAGIFALPTSFGADSPDAAHPPRLPYIRILPEVSCIEDQRSRYYGRMIDTRAVPDPDWEQAEPMARPDGLYRWGVVIDHNPARSPGRGSCIFLHLWRGPSQPTAGCTAGPAGDVKTIIDWLDPASEPILVQLPASEADRLRGPWGLPAAPLPR